MCSTKTILPVLIFISTSFSLDITISGKVTDTGTTPLPGAAVKLEKYSLTATSDINGNFTLSDAVDIKPNFKQIQPKKLSATIHNGIACLTVLEKTDIEIITYTVQGKVVSAVQEIVDAGTHSISLPNKGAGVYLYKIKSGKSELLIRSHSIGRVFEKTAVSDKGGSSSTVSAKRPGHALINDVIAVTKDGYLNYRVIVTNSDTSNIEIKMIVCADTVRDIDGNLYQAVRIGNQVWTVENLRVTRYNDGSNIPIETDNTAWSNLTTPGYCWYNNDATNKTKYGALYNWYTVNPANPKKIAPAGWHVPTDAEWDTLQNYLIANGYNWDGTTTENKVAKSLAAKTDWDLCSTIGTIGNDLTKNNCSGFSAFPGGYRSSNGNFYYQCSRGCWWSSTALDASDAYDFYLTSGNGSLLIFDDSKSCGFSVRLVKDSAIIIKPTITTHPQSIMVFIGQAATFGVIVSGTKPFEYKWQKNSSDIPGATDSTYTITATVKGDSGSTFRCIVSNRSGNDTSNSAILNVMMDSITTGTVTAGCSQNAIYGCSIDLDEPKAMLKAEADQNVSKIDICYAYSGLDSIEKLFSPHHAKVNGYSFAQNWADPNQTKFYKTNLNSAQFDAIKTKEEIVRQWTDPGVPATSVYCINGDVFIAKTEKGALILILITYLTPGPSGYMEMKVIK